MSSESIALEKLKALSPERQQEVLDFIEFLQLKDQAQASKLPTDQAAQTPKSDWTSDPFFEFGAIVKTYKTAPLGLNRFASNTGSIRMSQIILIDSDILIDYSRGMTTAADYLRHNDR